jgi:hypothetical protein
MVLVGLKLADLNTASAYTYGGSGTTTAGLAAGGRNSPLTQLQFTNMGWFNLD